VGGAGGGVSVHRRLGRLDGARAAAAAGTDNFSAARDADGVVRRVVTLYDVATITFSPVVGTSGGDTMRGEGSFDQMWGQGGNDTLKGKKGRDQLYGGGGQDILNGGPGIDVGKGGKGGDTCVAIETPSSC